jgi:hypothetical protein
LPVIQSIVGRRRAALLAALSIELLVAGWWRWPWTTAPIETAFDYGSGHVAVVSEHWRRVGALGEHFLPVMSIDRELPEWPYRTEFAQEYSSVPPLAFMLHYAATRSLPQLEPIFVAKLLAQLLIAASVLAAAWLLATAFGGCPIFLGLSFLIWGVPFLLWYSSGYFAITVGLAATLVLVAWCAHVASRCLEEHDRRPGWPAIGAGAFLAFGGAFADYMPIAANATAAAGLAVIAIASPVDAARRRFAGWGAAAIVAATVLAVGTTAVLYALQMGAMRYRTAILRRVSERTGTATFAEHVNVVWRQMLTAWPAGVLGALIVVVLVVGAYCIVSLLRRWPDRRHALVILLALAVAFAPSVGFHYQAVNYVRVHWWFAGTWTIGWAIGLCACADLVRRRWPRQFAVWCALFTMVVIWINVRFASAQTRVDAVRSDSVRLYRAVGAQLPHDDLPLVVADLTADWPGLFEDYPYATGYLRRPVLVHERDGTIRLPRADDPYDGRSIRIGGEDVRAILARRGGDVYVAYDPDARACRARPVPLSVPDHSISIAACRVPARAVADNFDSVLSRQARDYACTAPPAPPGELKLVINSHRIVVLSWSPSATKRSLYVVEAGRSRGESDALTADVGRSTTFTAADVQRGTYYVRVRGRNGCGRGAASNELVVEVE